jgi:hypothetical protein
MVRSPASWRIRSEDTELEDRGAEASATRIARDRTRYRPMATGREQAEPAASSAEAPRDSVAGDDPNCPGVVGFDLQSEGPGTGWCEDPAPRLLLLDNRT